MWERGGWLYLLAKGAVPTSGGRVQTPQYTTFRAGLRSAAGATEASVSAIATDVVLFEKVMAGGDVCGEV